MNPTSGGWAAGAWSTPRPRSVWLTLSALVMTLLVLPNTWAVDLLSSADQPLAPEEAAR